MTVCGKHGKTIKLFSHPSHKPWKSLRDSHIPSARRLIISIHFKNQKGAFLNCLIPSPSGSSFNWKRLRGRATPSGLFS